MEIHPPKESSLSYFIKLGSAIMVAYAGLTWGWNQVNGHNQKVARNDSAYVMAKEAIDTIHREKWQRKRQCDTNALILSEIRRIKLKIHLK